MSLEYGFGHKAGTMTGHPNPDHGAPFPNNDAGMTVNDAQNSGGSGGRVNQIFASDHLDKNQTQLNI
jgi:hypothetical protein